MKKFLYVFCIEARDSLLRRGYNMIKEDLKNRVFIFESKSCVPFPDENYAFVFSDTLSF